MHSLPALWIVGRRGWLPLAPGAVRLLFASFAGTASADQWKTGLICDPSLVGWMLANPEHGHRLRSARSLEALVRDAMQCDWTQEFSPADPSGLDRSPAFAENQPPTWDASEFASQVAQSAPESDAKPLVTFGLARSLTLVRRWLKIEGDLDAASGQETIGWMDAVWPVSRAALPTESGGQHGSDDSTTAPHANERTRAVSVDQEQVFEYWLGADTGLASLLPSLAGRLARAQTVQQQFHRELEHAKISALKELAYGASHEINNPLANISSRAQTLLSTERDPVRQKTLAAIVRQAFRAHEMIADMMLFAHPPQLEYSQFCLDELVTQVMDELADDSRRQQTQVRSTTRLTGESLQITADRVQVGLAIKALIRNALEAIGDEGNVWIETGAFSGEGTDATPPLLPTNRMIQIAVSDDGPGMTQTVRQHLFEPFYSGREAGRGLGFGMSKVWRIAEQHGGSVAVQSGTPSPAHAPDSDANANPIAAFQTCIRLILPVDPAKNQLAASSIDPSITRDHLADTCAGVDK